MKRVLMSILVAGMAVLPVSAGTTATFLKDRAGASAAVKPGQWHASLSKTKEYARSHGVPLIAVWSNGDACGHCTIFESACHSSAFKTWMKSSGCVFHFVTSADSGNSSTYSFCYKSQKFYPLVRIYWYKNGTKKVDIYTMGDTVDGNTSGTAGGKNAVSWLKKKLANFKPTSAPAVVKPYTIQFAPNGATNEMPSVGAKVGTARTLPANTFIRPDYSFTGWAKTATGAVAYKNKASVKNLTTVSNGVVTLYAKWKRITFRTYYTGISYTISMTDLKGWTPNKKVTGMKWNKSKGKWTGKPTKAGTFTIKFKKGTSSTTRKVVVVKDSIRFADETVTSHLWAPGEPIQMDLTPSSHAGTNLQSVALTGLPEGLAYVDGVISGASTKVGTFKVTMTGTSSNGQKLTRAFNLVIGVPDCCIGTFNGFIGNVDTNRLDELALLNRGMFRLSAPSSANLSAKIVTAKGTYVLTGLGWTMNGDGTYTAQLSTASGKDVVIVTVGDEQMRAAESFRQIGSFQPSYGTTYEVWAQRAPFAVDANGAYLDPAVAKAMPHVMKGNGKWYFQAYQVASVWILRYATAKTANLTLTVSADGTAKLAGKVGSYAVSAASAVFVFGEDVEEGFVRADFPTPISVKSGKTTVKKTLDIWLNLWFDRSNDHFDKRGEIIGFASVEAFQ